MSVDIRRMTRGAGRRARLLWLSTGSRVACCFCGWTGREFFPAGLSNTPNRKCPRCGSLERYRMLYLYLEGKTDFFTSPITVLEIGPKRCFGTLCRSLPNVRYFGADLDSPDASLNADIARLPVRDDMFDFIVCFHVLEHIPEDRAALAELHRVLKPGGQAVVQVPIRGEQTFEDSGADPRDYERLFGQSDHVRWYGTDIAERAAAAGFAVDLERPLTWLEDSVVERAALHGDDQVLVIGRKGG